VKKSSLDSFSAIIHLAISTLPVYPALLLISLGALKRVNGRQWDSFEVREILTKVESIANASGEAEYMNA